MQARRLETSSLDAIIVEPDDYDPERAYPLVILLHGFGSNMTDLAGLAPAINRSDCIYVCPNAPLTLELGYGQTGRAWALFESPDYDDHCREAERLLASFRDELDGLVRFDAERVVLGGFSQGGIMTYRVGLPRPRKFLALFALSARLDNADNLAERLPRSRDQRVFVAHGSRDSVINQLFGDNAVARLREWGYAPRYLKCDMAHEVNDEVVTELASWLAETLQA